MAYVTQTYDFYEAITRCWDPESKKNSTLAITNVEVITDNQYLVNTTHGKFMCESFEDKSATVYMKVYTVFQEYYGSTNTR